MSLAALPAELAARYEATALLGQGAMGVVVAATERVSGRAVAIKLSTALTELAAARFQREGELLAALRHPGIVAVHDAGLARGQRYLVMELVRGARPLDEALAGAPLRRKVEALRDVARAVGHAHARGIVHRDLKPANILVDEAGAVRVADFGIATAEERERLTLTGVMIGTPAYMAPEQLLGVREQIGKASDVWALGVVLYELLAGRRPFDHDSLISLTAAVLDSDPPPLVEAPVALEAVVRAALAREPADRLAEGEALAVELDRWLRGERPRSAAGVRPRYLLRVRLALAGCLVVSAVAVAVAPALRRTRASAALDEAQEWDGASCAARPCAGGPHRLARWALGTGDPAAPPALDEVAARAALLEAARARLGADSPRVGEAAELAARYRAHAALLGGQATRGETPTEQVVTLLLELREPAPLDPAVVASATALLAAGSPPPGAGEALDAGWTARLRAGQPTAASDLVGYLGARGGAEQVELRREARAWAATRWVEALALALREPDPARTRKAGALRELVGSSATANDLARLKDAFAPDVPATVLRLSTLEDGAALEATLLALRGAHELVLPFDSAPYRAAALALESPARALRLHAYLTRGEEPLRWRPTDRPLPAGQEEALRPRGTTDLLPQRVADALSSDDARDVAEAMVGAMRIEKHHLSQAMRGRSAPLMQRGANPEVVRLLKAIAAERPWSAAARRAVVMLAWMDATPGAALARTQGLVEVLALPVSDLRDGLELESRKDLVLCGLDAFDEGAPARSIEDAMATTGRALLATHHAAVGARGLVAVQLRWGRGARELHSVLRGSRYPDLASAAAAHEVLRRAPGPADRAWAEDVATTLLERTDDSWERGAFRPYLEGALARTARALGDDGAALRRLDGDRRKDALGVDVLEVVAPLLEARGALWRLPEWTAEPHEEDTPATHRALRQRVRAAPPAPR